MELLPPKKKPPKFLDAVEKEKIALRKMQIEKKITISNNEDYKNLMRRIKDKYYK